jgi:hypothetical protein
METFKLRSTTRRKMRGRNSSYREDMEVLMIAIRDKEGGGYGNSGFKQGSNFKKGGNN